MDKKPSDKFKGLIKESVAAATTAVMLGSSAAADVNMEGLQRVQYGYGAPRVQVVTDLYGDLRSPLYDGVRAVMDPRHLIGRLPQGMSLQERMISEVRNTIGQCAKGALVGGPELNQWHGCVANWIYRQPRNEMRNGPDYSHIMAYNRDGTIFFATRALIESPQELERLQNSRSIGGYGYLQHGFAGAGHYIVQQMSFSPDGVARLMPATPEVFGLTPRLDEQIRLSYPLNTPVALPPSARAAQTLAPIPVGLPDRLDPLSFARLLELRQQQEQQPQPQQGPVPQRAPSEGVYRPGTPFGDGPR